MKFKIQGILSMIVIAGLFFSLGSYIQKEGKPIVDFCKEHYNNKTFLETTTYFTEDDPSVPLICIDNIHNPYPYSNPDMKKCLKENATKEQVYFMDNCHWMGADYLILAGTIFFKFGFPLMFIVIGMASLFQKEEEMKDDRLL